MCAKLSALGLATRFVCLLDTLQRHSWIYWRVPPIIPSTVYMHIPSISIIGIPLICGVALTAALGRHVKGPRYNENGSPPFVKKNILYLL